MDFREYQNAYKQLMLREQIGTSSRVKQQLIGIIQYSTDDSLLDYYTDANIAENEIIAKQQMMQEYKDDPEILALLQNDIQTSMRLKDAINQRKLQLKIDKNGKIEEKDEKSDIEIATEYGRLADDLGRFGMAQGGDIIGSGYVMKSKTDAIEYIKYLVANTNQLIRNVRTNLEKDPNLLKVALLASQTQEFDSIASLARQTENIQGCDEELRALLQEEISEIQSLKGTIEKYKQQVKENQGNSREENREE